MILRANDYNKKAAQVFPERPALTREVWHVRPRDGYAEVLLRKWLEQAKPIKGFCFECGLDWEASASDRANVARALGVQL